MSKNVEADGSGRKDGRRPQSRIDPFAVYEDSGEEELERRLSALSVEELKDTIAQYGMDRDKLAMKWNTPERLTERIIVTVRARVEQGGSISVKDQR